MLHNGALSVYCRSILGAGSRDKTLFAKLFQVRIFRFSDAVGGKQELVTGTKLHNVVAITPVRERAQYSSAAPQRFINLA